MLHGSFDLVTNENFGKNQLMKGIALRRFFKNFLAQLYCTPQQNRWNSIWSSISLHLRLQICNTYGVEYISAPYKELR